MNVSGAFRFSKELAGLVLAGGVGARFGGPKAWALLPDGRTFLDACVVALREAGAFPLVATLPPGSTDPEIKDLAALPLPEEGLDMFASVKIGLRRLLAVEGWTRVAILPVDHPLVASAAISAIAASDESAAIPSFRGKHGHPVVVDRFVAEAIADGSLPGPTLREVLGEIGTIDVPVDDPGTIANCNTPDALQRALRNAR